jgi:DnaJ-class molecular chaperone
MVSEEHFRLKICPFCQAKNRVQVDKADMAVCGVCNHPLMLTHYDVLKVSPDASMQEIKRQYRRMVKTWHPDKTPNDPHASELFKAILEAYRILSNPEKRRQYDEVLQSAAKTNEAPSSNDEQGYQEGIATTKGNTDSDEMVLVMQVLFYTLLVCGAVILIAFLWIAASD